AAAARKVFEEERKRLDEQRRKAEEEKRKNEEQVVVAAWARYERGWMDLLNGVTADGRQLTFYDIPWPVAMPARSFDELQASAIERFLLSPYHSTTKTCKMRWSPAAPQQFPPVPRQRNRDSPPHPLVLALRRSHPCFIPLYRPYVSGAFEAKRAVPKLRYPH
ncbi:hypothetical protein FRC06_011176, partial [Ceratobasidium sp. 370]